MRFSSTLFACLFLLVNVCNAQFTKISEGVWEGTASYYHQKFNGRLTSNGEIFSNKKMTAASNFLKLGTKVKVTNLKNGKSVIVRINDRMNKSNGRLIDMSRAAAKRLDYIHDGLTTVRMEVVNGSKTIVSRYEKNDYVHSAKKRKAIVKDETLALAPEKEKQKRSLLLRTAPIDQVAKLEKAKVKRERTTAVKVLAKQAKVNKQEKSKRIKKTVVARTIIKENQKETPDITVRDEQRKSSRYWIEKRKILEVQLPETWLQTVSGYEQDFKEEDKYLKGALNSFMDTSQHFTLNLSDLSAHSSYRFILLSRRLDRLDTFSIKPMTLAAQLIEDKKELKNDIVFSQDADSYIYFFEYKVPEETNYLQLEWSGEKYKGASHEDFWLFVFEQ